MTHTDLLRMFDELSDEEKALFVEKLVAHRDARGEPWVPNEEEQAAITRGLADARAGRVVDEDVLFKSLEG